MENNVLTALGFTALILIFSCKETPRAEEPSEKQNVTENQPSKTNSVSSGGNVLKINNQLFNIPSPVQTAILIREQKIPFDESLITDLSKSESYVTSQKQALNLGVLGSDLAYLSNYNDIKRSLNFLTVVEDMAEKLNIQANINPSLIKRFNENISNVDSLNSLNTEFYRNAERYLKDNLQNESSNLILVGGWVESMYFATQNSENAFLKSRISEQKSIVKNLGLLMDEFKDPLAVKLKTELNKLLGIYKSLSQDYEYRESITDKDSNTTYIKSKSKVNVSEAQLIEIKKSISKLRDIITA